MEIFIKFSESEKFSLSLSGNEKVFHSQKIKLLVAKFNVFFPKSDVDTLHLCLRFIHVMNSKGILILLFIESQ